jgi:putative Mn2+ efflux pump MntP
MKFWNDYKELLGDALLIFFGAWMVYVFITIEILGQYGKEPNAIIRWVEIGGSWLIIVLGIDRVIQDIKRLKKK